MFAGPVMLDVAGEVQGAVPIAMTEIVFDLAVPFPQAFVGVT